MEGKNTVENILKWCASIVEKIKAASGTKQRGDRRLLYQPQENISEEESAASEDSEGFYLSF
jgi:hypothetical protein